MLELRFLSQGPAAALDGVPAPVSLYPTQGVRTWGRFVAGASFKRVALACSGVGSYQRGFERLFRDLFELLKDDLDITLFKGGGPRVEREIPLWNMPRDGLLHHLLPVHRLRGRTPYYGECWSFAFSLCRHLRRDPYDIVHYIDIPVGSVLGRLRSLTLKQTRLLFTQGANTTPDNYPAYDHLHQVAQGSYHADLAAGLPADRMSLVPCGLHADRFSESSSRSALRLLHRVPREAFVILSVAAINKTQKRLDHVIEEVAALEDRSLLWMDGQPEDPSLIALAKERLGERSRVTFVSSGKLGELYNLADIFVLGSKQESFGLTVVEAMCAGLPVITHNNAHFQWLVQNEACLVDMGRPGALKTRMREFREDPGLRERIAKTNQENAIRRFDWKNLKQPYLDLYERVMSTNLEVL